MSQTTRGRRASPSAPMAVEHSVHGAGDLSHRRVKNVSARMISAYNVFGNRRAFKDDALERSHAGRQELHELYNTLHAPLMGVAFNEYSSVKARLDPILERLDSGRMAELDDRYLCDEQDDLPLSIVVMSRNDTHVERMEDRTQSFIDCIHYLAEKNETNVELIVVEWNPPTDRPSMADQFSFPETHKFVVTRILTVTPEIHQRYKAGKAMPVFQMIAKNAGIRRARGRFIAVTNIDILFSEPLFRALTSPDLKEGHHYRSNRWDVDRRILDLPTIEEMLHQADGMTFQINLADGLIPIDKVGAHLENKSARTSRRRPSFSLDALHTEACGDFQMLHRRDWLKVRGYSEFDLYSFHIDSLFSVSCNHAGLEEVVLPHECAHYHIDHTLGVKKASDSYEINEKKTIKHISYNALQLLDAYQDLQKAPLIFNDANWGLALDNLSEWSVTTHRSGSIPGRDRTRPGGTSPTLQSSLLSPRDVGELNDIAALLTAQYVDNAFERLAEYVRSKANGRSIHVWGTGHRGQDAAVALREYDLPLAGFIDATRDQTGIHDCAGEELPVVTLREFRRMLPQTAFVVISTMFANDVIPHFTSGIWKEGEDFIIGL